MPETPKDKDQERGDEVLRRLLKTPPDHRTTANKPVNRPLTKAHAKQKPGGNPAKNDRPAKE